MMKRAPCFMSLDTDCKSKLYCCWLLSFVFTYYRERHGILSDVTFQRLSGTAVLLDFLELPSQLFEHWLSQPQILKEYVRLLTKFRDNYVTLKPI